MEKWKIIGQLKHDDTTYIVFLNRKHNKFFMKINKDNKLDYPTLEELNKLITKHCFKSCLIQSSSRVKTTDFDAKIYINKKIVPLAIATSMLCGFTGCSSNKDALTEFKENGIVLEQMEDDSSLYKIISVDTSKIKPRNSLNINSKTFENTSYKVCVPANFYEFYDGQKIGWKEIYSTLNASTIDGKIKNLIYDGLKNLEKNGFDMDLSVFNYNLQHMKINFVDSNELPTGVAGYFYSDTSTVYVNKNIDLEDAETKLLLLHEILGHGMTMAYIPENGGTRCSLYDGYYAIDNGQLTGSGILGNTIFEAIPEIIGVIASGNKIKCENGGYAPEVYTLQILSETLGCNLSDIANYGVDYLVKKMQENKIDDPYSFIIGLDTQYEFAYQSQPEGMFDSYSSTNLILEYFDEWTEDRLEENYSTEELLDIAKKSLEYNELIKVCKINDERVIIGGSCNINVINPIELTNTVLHNIEKKENKLSR